MSVKIDTREVVEAWAVHHMDEFEQLLLMEMLDDEAWLLVASCAVQAGMKYALENHDLLQGFVEEI